MTVSLEFSRPCPSTHSRCVCRSCDVSAPLFAALEAVLEVLKLNPEGMTALEILAEINRRYFDGKIVRTSLSPQLSRLKDRDHKIVLRGNRWYSLAEQPTLFTPKS